MDICSQYVILPPAVLYNWYECYYLSLSTQYPYQIHPSNNPSTPSFDNGFPPIPYIQVRLYPIIPIERTKIIQNRSLTLTLNIPNQMTRTRYKQRSIQNQIRCCRGVTYTHTLHTFPYPRACPISPPVNGSKIHHAIEVTMKHEDLEEHFHAEAVVWKFWSSLAYFPTL